MSNEKKKPVVTSKEVTPGRVKNLKTGLTFNLKARQREKIIKRIGLLMNDLPVTKKDSLENVTWQLLNPWVETSSKVNETIVYAAQNYIAIKKSDSTWDWYPDPKSTVSKMLNIYLKREFRTQTFKETKNNLQQKRIRPKKVVY